MHYTSTTTELYRVETTKVSLSKTLPIDNSYEFILSYCILLSDILYYNYTCGLYFYKYKAAKYTAECMAS